MHPFLQLEDLTEIVHSDIINENDKEFVKVYIEKPVVNGFHSAYCYLPDYKWIDIDGFTNEEIQAYQEILESTAHLISVLQGRGDWTIENKNY